VKERFEKISNTQFVEQIEPGQTPDGAEGFAEDEEEDHGPADIFAQQMFQLLSQQMTGGQALPPRQAQPRQQQATEHQGHAAGDRNIHGTAPPTRQAASGFTMSFGTMPGAFSTGEARGFNLNSGPDLGPGGGQADNPMLRGIASLLGAQFGGDEGHAGNNPLHALFGALTGGSGNVG
jgi:hypothetical protein